MTATVLYVDDDRNLCQIVGRTLRSEGYGVRTAFDGAEAVASLREDPPDLLLLDLLLPRRDGFEVLEEIRSMPPPVGRASCPSPGCPRAMGRKPAECRPKDCPRARRVRA